MTIFDNDFLPLLFDFLDRQAPWYPLSDDDLSILWGNAINSEKQQVGQDIHVVEKLSADQISQYRNAMKKAAVNSIKALFDNLSINTVEDRCIMVEWLLSESDASNEAVDGSKNKGRKNPQFYYDDIRSDDSRIGIFQSYPIKVTFATHLMAIKGVPEPLQPEVYPVGTLVMSVQAVKHVLLCYKTGELVESQGRCRTSRETIGRIMRWSLPTTKRS
ncbi:hypothetical protein HGRIS_001604 [Hohenbuehelia grisea]|uniref:DUF6532 domain-containing protein n=1 Tax=Hohenbuehelia grisea TaxID=104357 RepID=A0ABR3JHW6_9AGAR